MSILGLHTTSYHSYPQRALSKDVPLHLQDRGKFLQNRLAQQWFENGGYAMCV